MSTSPLPGSFNSTSSKVRGSLAPLKRATLQVLGIVGDMFMGWFDAVDRRSVVEGVAMSRRDVWRPSIYNRMAD